MHDRPDALLALATFYKSQTGTDIYRYACALDDGTVAYVFADGVVKYARVAAIRYLIAKILEARNADTSGLA